MECRPLLTDHDFNSIYFGSNEDLSFTIEEIYAELRVAPEITPEELSCIRKHGFFGLDIINEVLRIILDKVSNIDAAELKERLIRIIEENERLNRC